MMYASIQSAASSPHAAMALLCLFASVTPACEHHRVEDSSSETLHFDINERAAVEIRVDDGDVEVVGGAADRIEVVLTTRVRAADSAQAEALLQDARTEARQEGELLRIRAGGSGSSNGIGRSAGSVWTDITLRVPAKAAELELDIRTEDGSIDITAVSGTILAETADGRIRLSRVEGRAKLRTGDGSITGEDVTGELDVVSGDGRIRLDGSFTQLRAVTDDGSIRVKTREATTISGDWSLRTLDGSIELSLPLNADADLDATSSDGQIFNRLSRFEGSERTNRLRGRVGAGGATILVTTMDGRIVLKES